MSQSTIRKRGVILGKFMPPHLGHVYLVDFARNFVDELTVIVEHVRNEPIASTLRFAWMRELFPTVNVVHFEGENPQEPSEHPDFWNIWKTTVEQMLPYQPDVLFASESYGPKLASVLGAQFVPVDPRRAIMPISGTKVRDAPLAHWAYLPACVRPYFAKRVSIFGPESTGKSTLATKLAEHFQTQCVPEYARTLIEQNNGQITAEDMLTIARGQRASEAALERKANRVLICDTDVLATTLWSEVLFGSCPDAIHQLALERSYHLTLLLDVDVPWVQDVVRYLPNERRSFFERCQHALQIAQRPYVVIRGSWEERWEAAQKAVAKLLME
jgi:HTH-type transcriptional regulator, transcriptional repressor of NAD biosynthesis genes